VLIDGGDVNTLLNFRTPASSANVQLCRSGQGVPGPGEQLRRRCRRLWRRRDQRHHAVRDERVSRSAHWFHRNDNLDARNFFDPPAGKPEFKRNQFGGSLGGPILTNRTFFFFNYEGLRERLGTSRIAMVPTADMRRGIPRADGRRQSGDRAVSESWPLPNGREFGDGTGSSSGVTTSRPARTTSSDAWIRRWAPRAG
jgi:hypothetical protein